MKKTLLIVIGIACAVISAAGIMHYHSPDNVRARLLEKFSSVHWVHSFSIPTDREESISVITSLLQDDDRYVRQWAAKILGRLNAKESIPQIKELLKNKEWWVRETAQEALKALGVPEAEIQKAKEGAEQERLLYTKALGILKPKKIAAHYEINLIGIRKEVLDKMPRIRKYPYNKVTIYQENCEKAIKDLEELIRQYADSSHIQHYQETLTLLKQMLQEDKEFFYDLVHGDTITRPPVQDRHNSQRELSSEEIIKTYIHYLRKECVLDKIHGSFKMCFDQPTNTIGGIWYYPDMSTISCGRRILQMGNTAVPELVKLLDDRRPITVDDEIDNVPTRFYRYQDAAVDILEKITQRKLCPDLPENQYFSEYMEKQTPENKQKTISDIKQWVEDAQEGK